MSSRTLAICGSRTTERRRDLDPNHRTSEVEITFTALTSERTHVQLTHRHLDRHGEGWETRRDTVAGGRSLTPLAGRIEAANRVAGRALPVVTDETMRAHAMAGDESNRSASVIGIAARAVKCRAG